MSLGKNDKRWRCCFVTNSPMNILWKTSISWSMNVGWDVCGLMLTCL